MSSLHKRPKGKKQLDRDDAKEWMEIHRDLVKIDTVKLNGLVSVPNRQNDISYKLVCFCDASKKAYATSIYLVQQSNNETTSNVIFCKSRLAPVKTMTIPRLELLAVLIGVS